MVEALLSVATFWRFDSSRDPAADVLETGDIGGDKLSGLTRYVEKPRRADVLLGSTSAGCRVRHWLTLGCASADVLETGDFGGDKLSGDFGAWRTPGAGFQRKTSEFGGPGSTFDAGHEKRTFRSSPFSALFAPKTEWGDIGKTFSGLKNLAVLQGFGTKNPK